MRRRVRLFCTLLLLAAIPPSAQAQDKKPASLTGKVFMDPSMKPIAEAEVLLPDLSKSVMTDDKGAFHIDDIPAGIYLVRARKIGYAVFESRVEFRAGKTVELPVVLPKLTTLDEVKVVGEVYVPLSFLEHRATGAGHFFTREQLEKQNNMRLSNVLSGVPGAGFVRGPANQGYLMSKRYIVPISSLQTDKNGIPLRRPDSNPDLYYPDALEMRDGVRVGCYARVYLNQTLLNSTTPAEPININEYFAGSIEAIEYYDSASQVPSQYNRNNSKCGVLVIHTRKSP